MSFFQVPCEDEEFIKRAVKKDLILVPGFIFCDAKNYVRLSFATEWETLKRGMKALQELSKEN